MSFIGRLQQKRDEVRAQQADPWYVRLEGAHGKLGDEGVERVSTQTLFDFLELPQRGRTAAAGLVHHGHRIRAGTDVDVVRRADQAAQRLPAHLHGEHVGQRRQCRLLRRD
jgi:hypothetical protein